MAIARKVVRFFTALDWVSKWLGYVALAVASLLCASVFLLLCVAVITRPWSNFVFGLSFEIGGMLMWPIAFLPLAAVWRFKGHVRFDLALRVTRGRPHHALELASAIIVLAMILIIAFQSSKSFHDYFSIGRSTLTFRFQIWPAYVGVVVGLYILVLELVASIFRSTMEIITPTGVEGDFYDDPPASEVI